MRIVKPPRLRKGDLIGLVAPASTPSSTEKVEKGALYLEGLGYRVRVGEHVQNTYGYLAGTDADRVEDLNAFIRDRHVKAIVAIRGGYGTPRLLSLVDYRALKANPKIIVGYSDITALQMAVYRKIGMVTFSGPMSGVEMWNKIDPYTEEHFWRVVTSTKRIGLMENPAEDATATLRPGKGEGRLLGGNFSLLISLMGTPYMPDLRKAVLMLEDVDEAPHRIDRMLAQLRNAGTLRQLSALLFGKFTDCNPSDPSKPFLTLAQLQKETAEIVSCPVIANVQYGHIPKKLTIPFGLRTKVDGKSKKIEVLEAGVE
jgi:muramoyltetrapeptide carboxypeptidase